jgi:hypothetical protein
MIALRCGAHGDHHWTAKSLPHRQDEREAEALVAREPRRRGIGAVVEPGNGSFHARDVIP